MKAKHFKIIKSKIKLFDLKISTSLFGISPWSSCNQYVTVWAYNHRHACFRAKRKGYGSDFNVKTAETNATWGCFGVKLNSKHDNERHFKYY